ncbi:MAG: hypothetical protein Q9P14_03835 [candidate division KSB1 bacterium]|nr:hypothetical protein [candidate division KSB1 bacterium]
MDESTGRCLLDEPEPVALADVIEELLMQGVVREEMGRQARLRIQRQYQLENFTAAHSPVQHRSQEKWSRIKYHATTWVETRNCAGMNGGGGCNQGRLNDGLF